MYTSSMFWITFLVSGLIVASIPWVASYFNNYIAGFLVLLPVMLTLSLGVQYISHGEKATIEMMKAALWGLPTLLAFTLVAIIMLKNHVNLPLTILASLSGWLVTAYVINGLISK
jgi:uncharacterized membrane protein (GlpM family)